MQRGDSHSTLPRNVNAPVGLTWRLGVGISYRRVYLEISRPPSAPALVKNFWFTWVFKVKNHLKNKSKFQWKSYSLPYPVIFEDVWGNHDLPTNFFKEKTTFIYWVPVLKLQPNLPPFFLGDNKKLSKNNMDPCFVSSCWWLKSIQASPLEPFGEKHGFRHVDPRWNSSQDHLPRRQPQFEIWRCLPAQRWLVLLVVKFTNRQPTHLVQNMAYANPSKLDPWNPTIFSGWKLIQKKLSCHPPVPLRCFAAQRQQSPEGTRSWSNDRQSLCDSSLILLQMRFFFVKRIGDIITCFLLIWVAPNSQQGSGK